MKTADSFALQHSTLNEFVFAEVGTEANGMSLTLLSTLSRLGLDPWDEAQRLANMPSNAAAERVAHCITSLPGSLWPPREAALIAARLVQKLPKPGAVTAFAPAPATGLAAMFATAPFAAARTAGVPHATLARSNPAAGGPSKGLRIALLAALLASAGIGMALNARPTPPPAAISATTVAPTPAPSKPAAKTPAVATPAGK